MIRQKETLFHANNLLYYKLHLHQTSIAYTYSTPNKKKKIGSLHKLITLQESKKTGTTHYNSTISLLHHQIRQVVNLMLHCMQDMKKNERNRRIANQLCEPSHSKQNLVKAIVSQANQSCFHTENIEQQSDSR